LLKQREIQSQFEKLAEKYRRLAEQSSDLETENKQLASVLKQAHTNKETLEASLREAQEVIASHNNETEELRRELHSATSAVDDLENTKTSKENINKENITLKEELQSVKHELNVARTTHEKEAADFKSQLHDSEKKTQETEAIVKDCDAKLDTLKEENQELLREKQAKDLRLAELKMSLEQAQYTHTEKQAKTLNESFDLKEENATLWQDIEKLNQAVEQMGDEQKGNLLFLFIYFNGNALSRG